MLWIAVTPDKYELPLCVEPTAEKLAKRLGISENTVRSKESRYRTGKTGRTNKNTCSRYRIVKVEE